LRELGDSDLLSLLLYIPGSLQVTCDMSCRPALRSLPCGDSAGWAIRCIAYSFCGIPVKPKVMQLIKCSKFKKLPRMRHKLFESGESYLERRLKELITHSLTEQKLKGELMVL